MAHENIGAEIIEIFIVFTHSAHPEISKLSVNIIKQLSLIKGNLININVNIFTLKVSEYRSSGTCPKVTLSMSDDKNS